MQRYKLWLPCILVFSLIFADCTLSIPVPTKDYMCADGEPSAQVWEDLNANGVREENESGLAGVCITAFYNEKIDAKVVAACYQDQSMPQYSNASGRWQNPMFMYGGCGTHKEVEEMMAGQCARINITVSPPEGYSATTPTTVTGCQAEFGLVASNPSPSP